jgi:hypothetical protein
VPYPEKDAFHWTKIDWSIPWVKYLVSIDPTPKSIYTKWILRQWLNDAFPLFEDVSTAGDLLEDYDGGKKTLPEDLRDINRMKTLEDVRKAVAKIDPEKLISNRQMDRGIGLKLMASGDAIMHHDDDDIRIIIPKTPQAAIYYGRNTRWCTSARNGNMFHSYAKSGDLYIILFKKTNTRWQFHLEGGHLMNAEDRALSLETVRKSAVFKMFDWKAAFDKNPRLYDLLVRPTKAQRLACLKYDGMKALNMKNLSPEEILTAVKSSPSLITGKDTRFHADELRMVALKGRPNLILQLTNITKAEIAEAIYHEPELIAQVDQTNVDERMWRDSIVRNIEGEEKERYGIRDYAYGRPARPYYEDRTTLRLRDRNVMDRPLIYYTPARFMSVDLLRAFHHATPDLRNRKLYAFDMTKFNAPNKEDLTKIYSCIGSYFSQTIDEEYHHMRYSSSSFVMHRRIMDRLIDSYRDAANFFERAYISEYSYIDRQIRGVNRRKIETRFSDFDFEV